jgi:hypothetical protein
MMVDLLVRRVVIGRGVGALVAFPDAYESGERAEFMTHRACLLWRVVAANL